MINFVRGMPSYRTLFTLSRAHYSTKLPQFSDALRKEHSGKIQHFSNHFFRTMHSTQMSQKTHFSTKATKVVTLHDALKTGDFDKIKKMIKDNPNSVLEKDHWDRTTLHIACKGREKKSVEIVKYLLASGSSIDERQYNLETPLHRATTAQNIEVVELLLANGANPNTASRLWGPFHEALSAAAQHNKNEFRERALKLAAIFLKNGVNIDSPVSDGESFLFFAKQRGFPYVAVRFLVDHNVNVNVRNNKLQTPVHLYLQELSNLPLDDDMDKALEKTVHILLEKFNEVNSLDSNGLAPLHLAILKQRFNVVEKLLKKGADPTLPIGGTEITPMALALYRQNGLIATLLHNQGVALPLKISATYFAETTTKLQALNKPIHPYWNRRNPLEDCGNFCASQHHHKSNGIHPKIKELLSNVEKQLRALYHPVRKDGDNELRTPMAEALIKQDMEKVTKLVAAGWHAELEHKIAGRVFLKNWREWKTTGCNVLEKTDDLDFLLFLASKPFTGISLVSEFMRAISKPDAKYALKLLPLVLSADSFQKEHGLELSSYLINTFADSVDDRPVAGLTWEQEELAPVVEAAYQLGLIELKDGQSKWWEA